MGEPNQGTDERAQAYAISREDASWLAGIVGLPTDMRAEIFRAYVDRFGTGALVELFAQFVGVANSVVANSAAAVEIFAIVQGGMHPHEAEKLNLPTLFGAANGLMLLDGIDQEPLCSGCAFRRGTLANQSPSTTCDADYCGHPGEVPFFCHEELDEKGEPTKGCAGFAQLRAIRKAKAAA